jgi:SAM-dependent methyltransferase
LPNRLAAGRLHRDMGHGHGGHGAHQGGRHQHDHGHGVPGDRPRDEHGNPVDMVGYLARLESPEREAWQQPDAVVAALGLRFGQAVADVGCGPGYFTLRLARAVGPAGTAYGLDVDPRMTALLAERARASGLANVVPVLGADEPGQEPRPPRPVDLVLLVNAFHHLRDGAGALRRLAGFLAPGGRLALVEFHPGELPVVPPPELRVTRAQLDQAVAAAGLRLAAEHRFLPYQAFLVLEPGAVARRT